MSVDNKNTFSPNQTTPSKPAPPTLRAAEGPVSPARKPRRAPSEEARRSRKRHNALLHGITSNSPVIPGMEDEADWKRHCDGIVASIEPVGGLEEFLAQRLASLFWRLNRVVRYEVAATAEAVIASENYLAGTNLAEDGIVLPEPEIIEEQRELRILPPDHHLDRAIRPAPRGNATSGMIKSAASGLIKKQSSRPRGEAAFDTRNNALQARRKGHPVNLARVDFSGSPAT